MRVLFRCDAGAIVGTGHFMRCFALADELHAQGVHVGFCMYDPPEFIKSKLSGRSISLIKLQGEALHSPRADDYSSWSALSPENDAVQTCTFACGMQADWVVMDHYALDQRWDEILRRKHRLLVIDDLANRSHACDILLDQNEYTHKETRYNVLVNSSAIKLLGAQYALLSHQHYQERARAEVRTSLRRILICFGGSDPTGETVKLLTEVLKWPQHVDYQWTVVMGSLAKSAPEVQQMLHGRENFQVFFDANNIAQLMRKSDFSFGAGGSMTWERACAGLPAAVVSVSHNQVELCENLAAANLIYYLGSSEGNAQVDYLKFLERVPDIKVESMSKKLLAVTYGDGCKKVADVLLSPP
jgi:UDP-2,4-diacetamido-2,4,6-trideoxy-beta-L-altropyranose hydrolase